MSILLFTLVALAGDPIRAITTPGLTADTLRSTTVWASFPAIIKEKSVTLTLASCAASRCEVRKGDRVVGTATGRYANQEVSYLVSLNGGKTLDVRWAPGEVVAAELVRLGW